MLPLKDNGANPIVDSLAVVGEWNIVAKWVVDESGFCWVRVFNGWEWFLLAKWWEIEAKWESRSSFWRIHSHPR